MRTKQQLCRFCASDRVGTHLFDPQGCVVVKAIPVPMLLIFASLAHSTSHAQDSFSSRALPDATRPAQIRGGANDPQQTNTGIISGTVLDTNRDMLQGARVTVANRSSSVIRNGVSGSN